MKPVTEITADDLPFLIVHGAWIWKVVLIVLVLVSLFAAKRWIANGERKRLHYARWFGGAIASVGSWYLVMLLVGAIAAEKAKQAGANAGWSIEIAAASPRSRSAALRTYAWDLGNANGEVFVRRHVALLQMRGECPDETLNQVGRFTEAVAFARKCAPTHARRYLLTLGEYAAANEIDGELYVDGVTAAVGAGDWRKAAALIEKRRAGDETRGLCVAAMLRSFAGDRDASSSIEWDANGQCEIMAAIAGPAEQRLATLAKVQSKYIGAYAWWRAAGGHLRSQYERTLAPWLAHEGERNSKNDPDAELRQCELTHHAILLGDTEAARAHFGRCAASVPNETDLLHLAMLLSDHDPTVRSASYDTIERLAEQPLSVDRRGCRDAENNLQRAAGRSGDGKVLASFLRCALHDITRHTVMLSKLLPRITTDRKIAAHAFRWIRADRLIDQVSPFEVVERLGWYRDFARMLGDTEYADEIQTSIARHAKALADFRRVAAFYFLSEIGIF